MPLTNIKVIEIANFAPGALCSKFLQDFGATVFTVVKPRHNIGASFTDPIINRGKKSVSINLKSEAGVRIFHKLIKDADVLIETFRKGVMEKLGIGPDVLLKENPRLIYAKLSGFGNEGYLSSRTAHDINCLAISGLLSTYNWTNEKPSAPIHFSAYAGGSHVCFSGILLALLDRCKTGKGQFVDTSMVEGVSYLASALARGKSWLDNIHYYNVYETKDGKFMAVGAIEPQIYEQFLYELNLSSDDLPQYSNAEKNRETIQKKFKEKTQREWIEIFDAYDSCVTPVLTTEEAAEYQHNKDRKSFAIFSNDKPIPNSAPKLSGSRISEELLLIPSEGEHTFRILSDLGYSHDQLNQFSEEGTIEQSKISKL